MHKPFTLFALFALLMTSCSTSAPAPTLTPMQSATLAPTETPVPTSTLTPEPPTQTTDVIADMLPSGIPEKEWKGIPIMPGAINGDAESYRFTIKATVEEVQAYYEEELPKLGWESLAAGAGDGDSVMLIFNNGVPPLLPISIIRHDDLVLVLIVSSQ